MGFEGRNHIEEAQPCEAKLLCRNTHFRDINIFGVNEIFFCYYVCNYKAQQNQENGSLSNIGSDSANRPYDEVM